MHIKLKSYFIHYIYIYIFEDYLFSKLFICQTLV